MHVTTAVWVCGDYEASWKKALSGENKIKLLAIRLNGMFGKTVTSYQKLNIPAVKHDYGSIMLWRCFSVTVKDLFSDKI